MTDVAIELYQAMVRSPGPLPAGVAQALVEQAARNLDLDTLNHDLVRLVRREDCPEAVINGLISHNDPMVRSVVFTRDNVDKNQVAEAISGEKSHEVLKAVAEAVDSPVIAQALYERCDGELDMLLMRNPHTSDTLVCSVMERNIPDTHGGADKESTRAFVYAVRSREQVAMWYAELGVDRSAGHIVLATCADKHASVLSTTAWTHVVEKCVEEVAIDPLSGGLSDVAVKRILMWAPQAPVTIADAMKSVFERWDWSRSDYIADIEELLALEDSYTRDLRALQAGDVAAFEKHWASGEVLGYDMLIAMLAHPTCSTEQAIALISDGRTNVNIGVTSTEVAEARPRDIKFMVHLGECVPGGIKEFPGDKHIVALEVINLIGHLPARTGRVDGPTIADDLAELLRDDQLNDISWAAGYQMVEKTRRVRDIIAAQLDGVLADERKRALFECLADGFAGSIDELFAAIDAGVAQPETAKTKRPKTVKAGKSKAVRARA